jgi:hypothetical protein
MVFLVSDPSRQVSKSPEILLRLTDRGPKTAPEWRAVNDPPTRF